MEETKTDYVLMKETEQNKRALLREDKCDKYDYLAAVACGAVGGLVDIFLVGTPGDSVLGKWTDSQVDSAVKGFAKLVGWNPSQAQTGNVASAIGFLERKYGVNYDQRHTADVGNAFNMSAKNHHMMSLSHSPDIAGSSGARGNAGRGAGVVMPFYELFQFCKFGSFKVGNDRQDLATIATRAFQEGYDFRFGMAAAIPVVLTDLSIRLIWALRRHFQYELPVKECIPTSQHADLRIMLLLGNGTLCVMDGIDAGVRSGGNFLTFFMRLNLIAWFRFVTLVLKEVCIRVGLKDALSETILAFQRINEALLVYLHELEQIDIEAFKRETQEYNKAVRIFSTATTDKELNVLLLDTFEQMGIKKPWQGDFDKHMSDKNATLVFE